jgi:hypothetical protein
VDIKGLLMSEAALLRQLARIGQHDLRLSLVIADLSRHTDALAAEGGLGGAEFRAVLPTAVKMAFGEGFPRSNNVGCDFASASYSAEATTPHTVPVSPMWPAASSGLSEAAVAEKAHDPNTADAASSLTGSREAMISDCLTVAPYFAWL